MSTADLIASVDALKKQKAQVDDRLDELRKGKVKMVSCFCRIFPSALLSPFGAYSMEWKQRVLHTNDTVMLSGHDDRAPGDGQGVEAECARSQEQGEDCAGDVEDYCGESAGRRGERGA